MKFSLVDTVKEYEDEIERKKKEIEDLEKVIVDLKSEEKNSGKRLEKFNVVSGQYKQIMFENEKLRNELIEQKKILEKNEQSYAESIYVQKLKDDELQELSKSNIAEAEAVQEFDEKNAIFKNDIKNYRAARLINEHQKNALQYRRDHLQTRIELLKVCFESQTQSTVFSIPPVPSSAKLIADPEEILPEIFFAYVDSLQKRIQLLIQKEDNLIADKQYMLEALDEEVKQASTFVNSVSAESSVSSVFLNQREHALTTQRRDMLAAIRTEDEQRRLHRCRPTGLLTLSSGGYAGTKSGIMGGTGIGTGSKGGIGGSGTGGMERGKEQEGTGAGGSKLRSAKRTLNGPPRRVVSVRGKFASSGCSPFEADGMRSASQSHL